MSRTASFADGGEILDGVITRSRGEIKHVCSPKVTSSTATPSKEFRSIQSPLFSDKVYSPRPSELKIGPSPRHGGPMTGEAKPSNLGKSG